MNQPPITTTTRSPTPRIPGWVMKYKNWLIAAGVVVPTGTAIAAMYLFSQPYQQVDRPPQLDSNVVIQEAQADAAIAEQQMKIFLDGGSEPGEIYRILTVKAEEIRDHVDRAVRSKKESCYRLKKSACFDKLEIGVEKELESAALNYKTDDYTIALFKYQAIQLARSNAQVEETRPSTFKVLRQKVQKSRQLQSKTSVENQSAEVLIQQNDEAERQYEQ